MTATAAPIPFGKPDDALAGTCRYLIQRGGYRPGEPWGCEVRGKPSGKITQLCRMAEGRHCVRRWQALFAAECKGEGLGAGTGRARLS